MAVAAKTKGRPAKRAAAAPAKRRAPVKGTEPRLLSPSEALGVHGWRSLDAVLLAALALEAPVLLVGPHGTAKSLLVERVAQALGQSFRHYNASLLNYDDLVGIPLPDADGERLHFVATPGAIWGAEFVLLDEISRCRADLQNKLFPIVHERRVAGVELPQLRHRWAAMNPPSPDDPDDDDSGGSVYLGSEPLDPALADRFAFVLRVPGWAELTKAERRSVALAGAAPASDLDLPALVARCRERAATMRPVLAERIADYVVTVVDQLRAAKIQLSPRRSALLLANAIAVHAAAIELGAPADALEASVETALLASLPQTAEGEAPPAIAVRTAHRQSWELTMLDADDPWRLVLEETDPVQRVVLGDSLGLGDADLARLVTQALGAQDSEPRRISLATAMFLRFRATRDLTPAAWEPLAQLSARVLQPRDVTHMVAQGPQLSEWRELTKLVSAKKNKVTDLERNFLLGGYPDLWARCNWKVALGWLREDMARFGAGVAS